MGKIYVLRVQPGWPRSRFVVNSDGTLFVGRVLPEKDKQSLRLRKVVHEETYVLHITRLGKHERTRTSPIVTNEYSTRLYKLYMNRYSSMTATVAAMTVIGLLVGYQTVKKRTKSLVKEPFTTSLYTPSAHETYPCRQMIAKPDDLAHYLVPYTIRTDNSAPGYALCAELLRISGVPTPTVHIVGRSSFAVESNLVRLDTIPQALPYAVRTLCAPGTIEAYSMGGGRTGYLAALGSDTVPIARTEPERTVLTNLLEHIEQIYGRYSAYVSHRSMYRRVATALV